MVKDFSKLILEKVSVGYAVFRILRNEEESLKDLEFLELSPPFAALMGIRINQAVGKRAGEIAPWLLKNKQGETIIDEITTINEIKEISFNSDSPATYHKARAFCPEKNLLIIVFSEWDELEKMLVESERSKRVLLANLPGMAYRCNYDEDWTMQFVSEGCFELTGYKAESLLYNKELSFNEVIHPKYWGYLYSTWDKAVADTTMVKVEYEIVTASREIKWVLEQGRAIYNEAGNVEALEGLIIDITELKKREEEIKYINQHDALTDLYNRLFYEESLLKINNKDNLPLSIIIADFNGLKFVNDAFGHKMGDELLIATAKIIADCCHKQDLVFRTGGDEFIILLPKTNNLMASKIFIDIMAGFEKFNKNPSNKPLLINMSMGYATKVSPEEDIHKVVKQAEDQMFHRKLLERQSLHSALIDSLSKAVFEKSQETQEHTDRVANLSKKIGTALNLTQPALDQLQLLAKLHDVGKLGIDERVLNKPGKLNDEEWLEMKKHPEIGYRISMASPKLMTIAEYILSHHERWDGKGYPRGLEGKKIPLLARIIAVVDAYDAMTNNRPYRATIAKEQAIDELLRNSGTQFDPLIVKIFVEDVLAEENAS